MVQEEAEANGVPPKAGRGKRQTAGDQNAAGPSNEAAATKRPRGRPPKTTSEGPLAPTPIVPTPARKLRKATEVTQPKGENPSSSKEVAAKAPRISRTKRSRSSSMESPNDTASEGPKHRRSKKSLVLEARRRHGKARMAPSSRSSSVHGRRTRTGKISKDRKKK
ncbi:hypothetical protein MRX96_010680 [Rhipicephalus microplus]